MVSHAPSVGIQVEEKARSSLLRERMRARADALIMSGLFIVFLLVRLPFRSHFPINWDSVQFALGTIDFDIAHHQPHPPGYIGYIYLARLLNQITGDPHTSLIVISLVSGAIAPAAFYLLATRLMPRFYALLSATAFGSSMLVWYYSSVALTYIVEIAVALIALYFLHRAMQSVSTADLIAGGLMIAVLGSLRQSAMVLLLPLWLFIAWRFGWRQRIQAAVSLGIATVLWTIPLLWLAGGPFKYIRESRELGDLVGSNTSILAMNPGGTSKNIGFVVIGTLFGVNLGLILLAVCFRRIRVARDDRWFMLFWAVPALLTFILGHTGQPGYVLIFLPIPFLLIGILLARTDTARIRELLPQSLTLRSRLSDRAVSATVLASMFIGANVLGFLFLPPVLDNVKPSTLNLDVRQFDIGASDRHWAAVTAEIRNYPPEATAILTTIGGPRISGSFRHLSYLMPKYRVYGLGQDLDQGAFGPLFYARNDWSNYQIEGLDDAATTLWFPADVQYLVIPDEDIIDRVHIDEPDYLIDLSDGSQLLVIVVPPDTSLAFSLNGTIITRLTCDDRSGPCPPQDASRSG